MDDHRTASDALSAAKIAYDTVQELRVQIEANERRMDRNDNDRRRLGERVTALDERMTGNEQLMKEAVAELTINVQSLRTTADRFLQSSSVPDGETFRLAWQRTSLVSKAKLTAVVVAVVGAGAEAPELVKAIAKFIIKLVGALVG